MLRLIVISRYRICVFFIVFICITSMAVYFVKYNNKPRKPDPSVKLLDLARDGDLDGVKILLGLGADPNERSDGGGTPLFHAAGCGHPEVVRMLLLAGADATIVDDRNCTALRYALSTPILELESAQLLIDHGALARALQDGNPLFSIDNGWSAVGYIELLVRNGVDVNKTSADGFTPLMHFSQDGSPNHVKALLKHGARVNDRTSDGKTALSIAKERHSNDDEKAKIVEILIKAGATEDNLRPMQTP